MALPVAVPACLDLDGVAVITGGASGFGLVVATRLVKAGIRGVALLDIDTTALSRAVGALRAAGAADGEVLAVVCNVSKYDDCVAAQKRCATHFGGRRISFLFNNAGIVARNETSSERGGILPGDPSEWPRVFAVNVFGCVNVLKAFVPGMVDAGPLPSGAKSFVVTTSSVVGLSNMSTGPYSCSKMATTAIAEQLAIELEEMSPRAEHISPRSLHPTIAATSLLPGDTREVIKKAGGADADFIVDGLFRGMDSGRHYIYVDHPTDVPSHKQIEERLEDQRTGRRPRRSAMLGSILAARHPEFFEQRVNGAASKL